MHYYHIAPLKTNSPILTYQSQEIFQKGDVTNIPIKNKIVQGVVLGTCEKPDFACKEALATQQFFNPHQILLAEFIAPYYCCSCGLAYGLFTPFEKAQQEEKEGLANIPSPNIYQTKALNENQAKALRIAKSQNASLLFGDTGSGKTEIYMHLLKESLTQNKNAIFLMPEISLTPQMQTRLEEVFGDVVAIWHSKISNKKKQEILQKIQSGKIKIIAGARSALFLPLPNLGLLIIDEEHDDAYKSQTKPRYNARDISLYLANKAKIKIILGSATPSITSYHNAKKAGTLIRLKGRHFDSKKDILFEESPTNITPFLLTHLQNTLAQNQQAIIFLPTRAHFKTLICQACGQSVQCPFCSIDMSLHLDKKILSCHYCNYTLPIPSACPNCGSPELSAQRLGTAQLAIELQTLLPQGRIGIFDKDHTSTQNKLKKILNDFNRNQIDILIGTQMISKGHDYHNVNLAIILGMDYLLKSPDYRSFEKSVALIYQIAGRSGRKENGKVIIQSLNSEFLKNFIDDYEDFLHFELAHRSHSYPPFSKLATLQFANKDDKKAKDNMETILKILEAKKDKEIIIIGAGKCGIEKIASKYRYQIFLRSTSHTAMMKILHTLSPYSEKMGFEIDRDPTNIL
ncbi:primosomal protein N' [Helicobacter sp. 11S02596-1]|uniref:primosomal protein N' n=1 Tax=Helicobacter sp. 11S02596-1 TaxID=1476194 RepID=UPI000BA5DC4E|nr:primosomal protein N' [Helicobacter sp. 11S02596-1]PAF42336.1 primosomal protein N' [Helicobacter sp. 11S02596-1]